MRHPKPRVFMRHPKPCSDGHTHAHAHTRTIPDHFGPRPPTPAQLGLAWLGFEFMAAFHAGCAPS